MNNWYGQYPSHWKLERLQNYLAEINESNNPIKSDNVLSLTNKLGVVPYNEKGNQGNVAKENLEGYKLAYPNTIVCNCMNVLIGSVGISKYFGCVSPVYYVYKAKENADLDFINYVFQTTPFQKELRRYANGILEIRLRISSSNILKREIPIPSKEEQIKIVKVIKSKEEKINALITNEEKQIEKLKAYKQALISEVVTKGLDPNVPMKDSGVDWIGKIPKNWICSKLKNLLKDPLLYGANTSGKKDGNLRYIRITDITADGVLNDSNILYLGDEGKPYILRDGDLLFARSGATSGKTFLFKDCYGPSCFAGYLIKASLNEEKMLPQYLYYYTQSSIYENWKNQIFIQATIQNISANKYSILEVTVPPISEQHQIINYLSVFINNVDELIIKHRNKIEKLKQFRQSMIYEYVTGKRSVN